MFALAPLSERPLLGLGGHHPHHLHHHHILAVSSPVYTLEMAARWGKPAATAAAATAAAAATPLGRHRSSPPRSPVSRRAVRSPCRHTVSTPDVPVFSPDPGILSPRSERDPSRQRLATSDHATLSLAHHASLPEIARPRPRKTSHPASSEVWPMWGGGLISGGLSPPQIGALGGIEWGGALGSRLSPGLELERPAARRPGPSPPGTPGQRPQGGLGSPVAYLSPGLRWPSPPAA